MFGSLSIPFVVLLLVIILGSYLYIKRRKRQERISTMLSDPNLLAQWSYTPYEWQKAVVDIATEPCPLVQPSRPAHWSQLTRHQVSRSSRG
jgi:hypothetical protein